MEFKFEFSQSVRDHLEIIDSVLANLGQRPLLENPDFEIDHHSVGWSAFDFCVRKDIANSAPLHFYLEGDGIRIDVADIPETFEWDIDEIHSNKKDVIQFVTDLLTSYVFVDTSRYETTLTLFDINGKLGKHFLVRKYFFFQRPKPRKHLYFPLYTST